MRVAGRITGAVLGAVLAVAALPHEASAAAPTVVVGTPATCGSVYRACSP